MLKLYNNLYVIIIFYHSGVVPTIYFKYLFDISIDRAT